MVRERSIRMMEDDDDEEGGLGYVIKDGKRTMFKEPRYKPEGDAAKAALAATEAEIRAQDELQAEVRDAEAQSRAEANIENMSREPGNFHLKVEEYRDKGNAKLDKKPIIRLLDADKNPLVRPETFKTLKERFAAGMVDPDYFDKEYGARLDTYVPELKIGGSLSFDMVVGQKTLVEIGEKDGKTVIHFRADMDTATDLRPFLPDIIRAAVEQRLGKQLKAVEEARKSLQTTKQTLHKEHLEGGHREHKLHAAEKKVVEAREKYENALRGGIKEILDRVMEEQHLDLATSKGGTEAWLHELKEQFENSLKRDAWQGRGLALGEHIMHELHPNHEHAHEGEGQEEKKGLKEDAVKGWNAYLKFMEQKVEANFLAPIAVDRKMIDGTYKRWEEDIKKLPEGRWNNFVKESKVLAKMRKGMKMTREAWQVPKHFVMRPAFAALAVGAGIGTMLWDLSKFIGLHGAVDEVKDWGKWALHQVGIDVGKKGGGGGHGGGH